MLSLSARRTRAPAATQRFHYISSNGAYSPNHGYDNLENRSPPLRFFRAILPYRDGRSRRCQPTDDRTVSGTLRLSGSAPRKRRPAN
jgi:hypothetical protein